jgi:hypothetical protein
MYDKLCCRLLLQCIIRSAVGGLQQVSIHSKNAKLLRASPAVEGPQAEIRRYLAPDGCKFRPGEARVSSGEPRVFFEFKLKVNKFW